MTDLFPIQRVSPRLQPKPEAPSTPAGQAGDGRLAVAQRALDASPSVNRLLDLQHRLNGPRPVVVGGGVVQRMTPKDALGGLGDADATVPDLSKDVVAKIKAAIKPAERQKLLEELKDTYIGPKLLDSAALASVTMKYGEAADAWGWIDKGIFTVNAGAFAHPSLLYSVFRHELIHVEQMRKDQDSKHAGGVVAYQDYKGNKKVAGNAGYFLHAAQEVETHSWEIMNIEKTGAANLVLNVPGGTMHFLEERVTSLNTVWKQTQGFYAELQDAAKAHAAKAAKDAAAGKPVVAKDYAKKYAAMFAKLTVLHRDAIAFATAFRKGGGASSSGSGGGSSSGSGAGKPAAGSATAAAF